MFESKAAEHTRPLFALANLLPSQRPQARVDLGLRFVEAPGSELLVPAKAPGQSTHKIGLTSTEDVNDEVGSLIAIAYQQNGR